MSNARLGVGTHSTHVSSAAQEDARTWPAMNPADVDAEIQRGTAELVARANMPAAKARKMAERAVRQLVTTREWDDYANTRRRTRRAAKNFDHLVTGWADREVSERSVEWADREVSERFVQSDGPPDDVV